MQENVEATFRSPTPHPTDENVQSNKMQEDVEATFRSPNARPVRRQAWRRKRNRLEPPAYAGNNAYLVTQVTADRGTRFLDEEIVEFCRQKLISAADIEHFELLASVFMPDHLHVLTKGSDGSSLPSFMKRFKQETAFWFKQRTGSSLWQKSFHDHVARREEDLNTLALYIAPNPVRAGFANNWESYQHWGGILLRGAAAGHLKVAATSIAIPPILPSTLRK